MVAEMTSNVKTLLISPYTAKGRITKGRLNAPDVLLFLYFKYATVEA
jgi:hypothetical protein